MVGWTEGYPADGLHNAAGRFPSFGPMEAEVETKVIDRDSKPGNRPAQAKGVDLTSAHRLVGRYELIHRLGHGGMATVYLGRAIGTAGFEKLVAVKVIHPHLASEAEFVEMFLDEARIASRLHHPHVVEILDLGRDEDVFFMVMEYVEGDTLASLLRQLRKAGEKLPLAAVLQIIADACEGLVAAHELADPEGRPYELVHRDVSPHNLLVGMDGRVKVVDFGVMKAAGKRSTTLTGQLRGKLAYMSPEQVASQPLDHRTDLFAMGLVLWEMCSGERLFTGESESEILGRVAACEIPDILDLRPELPGSVRDILDRALAVDRDNRYGSAREMLKDVRALLRKLDDDDDPRASVADIMERFFSGRIEYIRATVRGAAEGGRAHRSSRNLSAAARAAAIRAGLDDTATPPASSSAQRRLLGSTGTLTTSLAEAPARHWSLWLLLPLLGAAIGTAVVTWDRGDDAEPAAVETPEVEAPRPEPAVVPDEKLADAEADPTSEQPEVVKWTFNTEPDGATIKIDGDAYEKTTPVSIELPRSDETVVVRIEKRGYLPQVLHLAPLKHDNHVFRLERTSSVVVGDPKKSKARLGAKQRTKDGEASDGDKKKGPDDGRTLEEMPDFRETAGG